MTVFDAIADPVRRSILESLNDSSLSAGDIASRFAISRPAISRHLRVLREDGLVSVETSGRRQIYRIAPESLQEIEDWLNQFRTVLPSLLDALETEVYRTRRERRIQLSDDSSAEEQTA